MKNTQTTPTTNQSRDLTPEECAACAICLTADAIEIAALAKDLDEALIEHVVTSADASLAADDLDALVKNNVRLWDLLEAEIAKQPVDVTYDTFAVETLVKAKNSGPVAQNLLDTFLSYQTRPVGRLIEDESAETEDDWMELDTTRGFLSNDHRLD